MEQQQEGKRKPKQVFALRLEVQTIEAIKRVAAARGTSPSELVRTMLLAE